MARGKRHKSTTLRVEMAARLTAARKAYNENASQVARDLDITPQVLNAYETARNYPDELFLVKFCELTGCPMDWIFRAKMETRMPVVMATRIAHGSPQLIPGLAQELMEPGRARASASVEAVPAPSAAAHGRGKLHAKT